MASNDDDSGRRIYQNINQSNWLDHKKHWSVYGESHYLATGVHSKGPWDPTPLKGVSSYPPEMIFTLEVFLDEYDKIVPWISDAPLEKRNPEQVKFLLHSVFPHLETMIAKSGRTGDILNIILSLSCIKQCPFVTRYALHMVLDALTKTSYDSGGMFNEFLLKCETCLRDSLLDANIFDFENAENQGLRIYVYSRSLIILYANIVQGTIPMASVNKDFKKLHELLCSLEKQVICEEKDKPRYAICCIKQTIARLSRIEMRGQERKKSLYAFLKWLREYNNEGEEKKEQRDDNIKHFLSIIKSSKKGWFHFHVALFCLGSQIHKKPQNREVLRALVENYIKQHSDCRSTWSSDREWQTGLVIGSVLEDIVSYNHDRVTRTLACLCLIYCFNELARRKSAAKTWLHKSLRHCLYGPNRDLREVILKHLEMEGERKERNEDDIKETMKELLPISQSIEYLVQRYKKQILPSSIDSHKTTNLKGYFLAEFRDEKALIKILSSTKGEFVREERTAQSKNHQQLVIEAYTLRRLNANPHPNILKVFAYDTSAQPYHIITELVSEGSLLQFLHSLRSRPEHMPAPSILLQMMFGIMEALIYLNEQHLVHLALMAANVLVSHDNVCKLTGFQFVREMTRQGGGRYFAYVSTDDEMATRHAAPECLERGFFSENSVSWAIGVLLFEMHTYGVCPYNQYNHDQADQIRSQVIGRAELKIESCIRSEVCEVIIMCLTYEKENRPSLEELRMTLKKIHDQIIEEGNDCPAEIYPALTNVDLAQTKDEMISSAALKKLDKEKNLGNFGSEGTASDRPTIRIFDGKQVIRELVNKKEADLDKLLYLKHNNVVTVTSLLDHDKKHVALATEYSGLGNLLQTVLAKKCSQEQLVTFLAQIAQGLYYLHHNYMIHGDLRAEHIMVFPNNEVKVSRLGRCKSLENVNTKLSTPADAIRWSPPEVLNDGIYSRASDVYSYGIMCYELFNALEAKEGSTPDDVKPFSNINDNQILVHLQDNKRPDKPNSMAIWLNIIVKKCLLGKPKERPVFAVIVDALTFRKPFESYLLSNWMRNNEPGIVEVNVTQSEEASHVIPNEHHKTFEELCRIVYDEIKEEKYEEIPALKRLFPTESRPLPCKPTQETANKSFVPSSPKMLTLPEHGSPLGQTQNRKQQNNDEDAMSLPSNSDEQSSSYPVPDPTASVNIQNVEYDNLRIRDTGDNQGQEYMSMVNHDVGATESSWHSLPLQNSQQHGSSSSGPTGVSSNNTSTSS